VQPQLNPRRRNIINDPALQRSLDAGDIPWQRGNLVTDPEKLELFQSF